MKSLEFIKRDFKTLAKDTVTVLNDLKKLIKEIAFEPIANALVEGVIFVWAIHEKYLEYKENKQNSELKIPQCVMRR